MAESKQAMAAQAYGRHPGAARGPLPSSYRRREPERSILYETVRTHWNTLLAEVAQRTDGGNLPGFVVAEFERYLSCGILAHGFARVHCDVCGKDVLVAFSCRGRGFCPSCTTRRMQGTAIHLVDRVIPRVPVRQWVLSLPRWARFLLARDPALITRTLDLCLREIFNSHRRRARRAGARASRPGAISFVQRFGSAISLNVHFHSCIPNGVFVREHGQVRFEPLDAPSDDEVKAILQKIIVRVRKLLRPRLDAARDDARTPDALAGAQADSVATLFGKPADAAITKKHATYHEGFSLHAGVHLHANDREGLTRLCGYGARPALSQDRLSELPDGRLAIRMKRPLTDGRQDLQLEPVELLRRLATLVPPPRAHLVRFHGIFGPASKWRSEIVPAAPVESPHEHRASAPTPAAAPAEPDETAPLAEPSKPRRPDAKIPWAELLQRVFLEDVLACPCGGRRTVIAFITKRTVVKAILEHLGLPTTGPPIAPARSTAPPDLAPWQDDVPALLEALR